VNGLARESIHGVERPCVCPSQPRTRRGILTTHPTRRRSRRELPAGSWCRQTQGPSSSDDSVEGGRESPDLKQCRRAAHFLLDSGRSFAITYRRIRYLRDNRQIFDDLIECAGLGCCEVRCPCRISPRSCSEAQPQPTKMRRNSNVSKILPLTTLRTIDLEGKKISGRLFSRFCAKTNDFFKEILHHELCTAMSEPSLPQTTSA
jgi:hypothetical protein